VRSLEQTVRGLLTVLQSIHQHDGVKKISEICGNAKKEYPTIRDQLLVLRGLVPANEYYRYSDHWRFVMQRLSCLVALQIFLEEERLAAREEIAKIFGIEDLDPGQPGAVFHLDLDDYLMGLLQMVGELSRFSMNSVTSGCYGWPGKISKFVTELNNGFRLLNLKNDSLRKRFDGLKYDLKKIEEVVYDLSIRGLLAQEQAQSKE